MKCEKPGPQSPGFSFPLHLINVCGRSRHFAKVQSRHHPMAGFRHLLATPKVIARKVCGQVTLEACSVRDSPLAYCS